MLVEFEPSAEPDLHHRPFTPRLGENDKGGGGEKVEPGGVGGGGSGLARGLVSVERAIEGAGERSLVDVASLKADPFCDLLDMGGGIAPDAKPGPHERGLDQRRDRPLALGSCDVDRAKRLLRFAKPRGKVEHRLEPDPHRCARPALPVGQGVEARHRAGEFVILSHRSHVKGNGKHLAPGARGPFERPV